MINKQQHSIGLAVTQFVEDISVPAFSLTTVEHRRPSTPSAPLWLLRSRRRTFTVLAAAVLLVAVIPSIPGVVAAVSRVVHAFVVVNGQEVRAKTRNVSIDQALSDMRFHVVAPAGIPPHLHETITEVYTGVRAEAAQLWFRYQNDQDSPAVTIIESANSRVAPREFRMTKGAGLRFFTGGATISASAPSSATHCALKTFMSGSATLRTASCGSPLPRLGTPTLRSMPVRAQPIEWVENGTLIVLIVDAGSISAQQGQQIRAAMSAH